MKKKKIEQLDFEIDSLMLLSNSQYGSIGTEFHPLEGEINLDKVLKELIKKRKEYKHQYITKQNGK